MRGLHIVSSVHNTHCFVGKSSSETDRQDKGHDSYNSSMLLCFDICCLRMCHSSASSLARKAVFFNPTDSRRNAVKKNRGRGRRSVMIDQPPLCGRVAALSIYIDMTLSTSRSTTAPV